MKQFVTHGRKQIQIPVLQGPVGPESTDLRKRYTIYNRQSDVEIIQYYISKMQEIGFLPVAGAIKRNCLLNPPPGLDSSDVAALRQLQSKLQVRDAEETTNAIVKPAGETLRTLVDYGDYAGALQSLVDSKNPADFTFRRTISPRDFVDEVTAQSASLQRIGSFDRSFNPNLSQLFQFMLSDPFMIDIRWVAYTLATVGKEANAPAYVEVVGRNNCYLKKGWFMQWAPITEVGGGKHRSYEKPVKVLPLSDGTVQLTEWDGDQFIVKSDGSYTVLTSTAGGNMGTVKDMASPNDIYTKAKGTEQVYLGRGYMQLTWWHHYATAGLVIGRGLDLLVNPELALDPTNSYKVMSHCLRTGYGFANGRKMGDYFYGSRSDYEGARAMVNAADHASVTPIANAAKLLVGILQKLTSRQ